MRLESLPKESTARVTLAVLAFVAAALAAGESVWYTVYSEEAAAALQRCVNAAVQTADPGEQLRCRRGSESDRVLWTVAWGPGALGVAIVGGAAASSWRRRHLHPVPLNRLPALAQVSAETAAEVGSRGALPLLWRPARPVATARADGILSPYIEIGPALLGRSLTAPRLAKAIIRHEYAHHRLQDVLPSRVLLAAGYVGLVLVALFVATIWAVGFSTSVSALFRLLLVVGVVAAARANVLRAREFDADLWAADKDGQSLQMALAGAADAPRRFEWLTKPFAHHPSASSRQTVLREPWRTYQPSALDAGLAGLTAAVGGPVLSRLARNWLQTGDPALYAEVIGWAITGIVLGAWLGMVVARALIGLPDRGEPLRLAAFSWTLGASVLVGGVVFSRALFVPVRPLPGTLVGILALVALALGLVISTLWLRGFIEWWLMAPVLRQSSRWRQRVPIVAGAMVNGLLLGILATLESSAQGLDSNPEVAQSLGLGPSEPLTLVRMVHSIAGEWFSLVLVVLAFVVPIALVIAVRGEEMEKEIPWRRMALLGVVGVALALVSFILYRAAWNPVVTASENGWYASVLTTYASQAIVGGVVAATAAAIPLITARAQVPLSALVAATGALPAGVGTWLILGGPVQALPSIIRDVAVIAVLGALLGSTVVVSWGSRLRSGQTRSMVSPMVPILASAVLVWLGVLATQATPSKAADESRYFVRLQSLMMTSPGYSRLDAGACAGPVDVAALPDLIALRSELNEPFTKPGTEELRSLHDSLTRVVTVCIDATRRAASAERSTLAPIAVKEIGEAAQNFETRFQRLQGRVLDE
ncbi:MAG: hypothetical protein KY456_16025 [Chloroflexi bacterium]|nr:hypothetical protein [Chloroflexota bacterium]